MECFGEHELLGLDLDLGIMNMVALTFNMHLWRMVPQ